MGVLSIAATVTPAGTGAQPVTFHGWTGYIPDLAEVIDAARRPGQDGRVAQGTGAEGDLVECTAERFFVLPGDAHAFASSIRALQQPTPAKLVDPWARTLRVRFHRALGVVSKQSGIANGTARAPYRVACTFTVERFPDGT